VDGGLAVCILKSGHFEVHLRSREAVSARRDKCASSASPQQAEAEESGKLDDQQQWTKKLFEIAGNASAGVPAHLALSQGKCE
jgi:hypothetical protein